MDHQVVDLTCCPSGGGRRSNGKSSSKVIQQRSRSASRSSRPASSSSQSHNALDSSTSRQPSERPEASDSSRAGSVTFMERFPGDGLDFRTPVQSTALQDPPNVIDLTASDDEEAQANDDVQITGVTTNSTTNLHATTPRTTADRQPRRGPRFAQSIMNDEDDSDEAVERLARPSRLHSYYATLREQRRLPHPIIPQLVPQNSVLASAQEVGRSASRPEVIEIVDDQDEEDSVRAQMPWHWGSSTAQHNPQAHENPFPPGPAQPQFRRAWGFINRIRAHLPNPGMLDYTQPGFALFASARGAREAAQDAPRAPSPTHSRRPSYEELPPVPEGFTRSPREGETLICPFCKEELCIGEGDAKSQIWAAKACGHVYCGACANNRPKPRTKKTMNEEKLTTCVVPDCGERLTGAKAMYQLFL